MNDYTFQIQNLLRYGNRKPNPTYWCKRCRIPLIQEKCESCGKQGVIISKSPLRPVYKDELDIIRKQCKAKSKWLSLADLSFWTAKRNYFYNGEKIFTVTGITDLPVLRQTGGKSLAIRLYKDNKSLPKRFLKTETIIARLKEANQSSLNRLEYQSIEFIEQAVKTFHGRLPVVSFSGGKDSCVVSHLVRLALGSKILHIFGDTTIEYPDTYEFMKSARIPRSVNGNEW